MSDPNGWVGQPPTTLVKVHGVASRPALNGCYGVVLHYAADRQRYTVHMAVTQTQIALKAENLSKCTWREQAVGQWQLLTHDPTVRRQVQTVYSAVQARTGVAKPEYLLAGLVVALIVLGYFISFTRLVVLLSFGLLVFTVVAPDVMAGASRQTIMQNAPMRCREMIRQGVPVVGDRIASSPHLSAALVGVMVVILVRSMWPVGAASASNMPPPPPLAEGGGASSFDSTASSSLMSLKERYYKLGFDDATKVLPYGTSLEQQPPTEGGAHHHHEVPPLDLSSTHMPPPATTSPWQYLGTAMSCWYVFNTLKQLGQDAVTGQFDVHRLQQNISTAEPWRLGMLAFSIYRIVKVFL